jgi:hypothetical protein
MRQTQHPAFERISETLRTQYDEIVQEPLPQRWIDLIRNLNERRYQSPTRRPTKCARHRRAPVGGYKSDLQVVSPFEI